MTGQNQMLRTLNTQSIRIINDPSSGIPADPIRVFCLVSRSLFPSGSFHDTYSEYNEALERVQTTCMEYSVMVFPAALYLYPALPVQPPIMAQPRIIRVYIPNGFGSWQGRIADNRALRQQLNSLPIYIRI